MNANIKESKKRNTKKRSINPMLSLEVRDDAKDAINNRLREIVESFEDGLVDSIFNELAEATALILQQHLSVGILSALEDFKRNPEVLGLHLSNMPALELNEVPPTPTDSPCPETERVMRFSDAKILGLLKLCGYRPFASPTENLGYLVRNVIAASGYEFQASSHGSKLGFKYHLDQPSGDLLVGTRKFSLMPQALAWEGIRNYENVETNCLSTDSILAELSYKTVQSLREPKYLILPPESNELSTYSRPLENAPLLIKENNQNVLRYDPTSVSVMDTDIDAHNALEELETVLGKIEPTFSLNLQPSDILIIKNRFMLHSRRAFNRHEPSWQSRWLRRIYGV